MVYHPSIIEAPWTYLVILALGFISKILLKSQFLPLWTEEANMNLDQNDGRSKAGRRRETAHDM